MVILTKSELIKKGLEAVIKYEKLTQKDFEFIGRVESLKESSAVDDIVTKTLTNYDVRLKEKLDSNQIIRLLNEYGFQKPDHYAKAFNNHFLEYQLNKRTYMLKFFN